MRAHWVIAVLLLLALAPLQASGAPTPGNDPTCGTGQAVTATSGAGDPALPSLVYASLKTGFRAVIAWETAELEAARLRYSLDGGATQVVVEQTPRYHHMFVIDGLPIGRSLCFTPLRASGEAAGSLHAFRTVNAMNAREGDVYTANFLVLANQVPDAPGIEWGLDTFAERLWDATDGHVRAGRIILVVQDPLSDNTGWKSCYLVSVSSGPICKHYYDAIFTYDIPPSLGVGFVLAATYSDGIQRPRDSIWMNLLSQGGFTSVVAGDIGGVLMHEVGHYVFGAQDLYGPNGAGPNCWDPVTGISVMGNNFGANEFDDELHRCPPGSLASGGTYVPSYTKVRQRFPFVPDRTSIDPGPAGTGGVYARNTIEVLPPLRQLDLPLPSLQHDDAGSGRDAGNFLISATPIETGRTYSGTLLTPIDGADIYVFTAPLGSAIEVAMYPPVGCFDLLDASGAAYGGPCVNDGAATKRAATGTGGPLYVKFALGDSPSYRFGVGADAPAPGPV